MEFENLFTSDGGYACEKKSVFTHFIQQAIANSKLDYFTDWGRHRVRSLFCCCFKIGCEKNNTFKHSFKKISEKNNIGFFFTSIRMSLHVLVRFQHYFFFNAICGLLRTVPTNGKYFFPDNDYVRQVDHIRGY